MKYDTLKSKYVTDIHLKLQHSAKFNNKTGLITLLEHKKADCLSRLWLRRKDLNQ